MKQKIILLTGLFLLSISISFASDTDKNSNKKVQKNKIENKQTISEITEAALPMPVKIKENRKSEKVSLGKKIFRKIKKRFETENVLNPQRKGLALAVIGFLIFLPGMILTFIGVALIPALVLILVGGALWLIGLLIMKNAN